MVRVAVLADDLIWASRVRSLLQDASAEPVLVRDVSGLERAMAETPFVVVDLTARAYDGLAAVRAASASGGRVLCLAQHDDLPLRRAALEAGAQRVVAYGLMARDGPAVLRAWLGPAARPEIPLGRYGERLRRAAAGCTAAGLDALLIGVGADLRYLAGYEAMPLERLTMLVVPAAGLPALVAPRLETARAAACPAAAGGLVDLVSWEETDDPVALVAGLVRGTGEARQLAVSDRLWAQFVLGLQAALPGSRFLLASAVLREQRIVKDADEIRLLQLAGAAADRVIEAIAAGRLIGRTEVDVAREVRQRLVAEGHQSAGFAIVGSGPNSASPHHDASERVIEPGEPIVLDIGGALGGYGSDVTRTLWVTGGDERRGPDDEFRRLFGALQEAQAEATAAVRPGIAAAAVDRVARDRIAAAGFGPAFIHRTGHGIGLEEHEPPYLVAGNDEPLGVGMAFSIEPGIYLDGRYGARIEDIVVCTANGPRLLNGVRRDLLVVDG